MRKRVFAVARCPSVHLSVRLSVVLVHSNHTAKVVKLLCWPGSPMILVLTPSAGTEFQGEPLQRWHKIQRGGKILRFLTEIAVYLGNGTR